MFGDDGVISFFINEEDLTVEQIIDKLLDYNSINLL